MDCYYSTTYPFFRDIVLAQSNHADAQGDRIPAEELKEISRLSFTLRDAYQTP
ncbi:hypothetical protein QP794_30785 [Paenibacillus sp. UMB7766-LJ446]|uniref:hypothetical protein n=1 Tax=Paenibacillus sp. UMB7766-LJ446 TaxID=3046313 RepID=UPI00254E7E59|nr:hypothetical protein [Paenibacillus sp. UMB7766-LJ446]MDK8194474.1 hypothetical protein [Paenibacillus sp. UMB7766-LJ446]